jgi:catechol 2,3-dioxygenase-like lactoylglutathione lyase family enzyme/GNAT superfamily N-acetyltransferase
MPEEDGIMEFSEPVTTFVVEDVGASLTFYRDVLGFAQTFAVGDPPIFAGVHQGGLVLYLQSASQTDRPPGGSAVSVRVDDARAVHTRLERRGAADLTAAEKRPYGLVEFTVRDPDGNQITVGSIVTADSPPAPQGNPEQVTGAAADFHLGFGLLAELRKMGRRETRGGLRLSVSSDGRFTALVTSGPGPPDAELAKLPRPYEVIVFPGKDPELVAQWTARGHLRRYVEYAMQIDVTGSIAGSVSSLVRARTRAELDRLSTAKQTGRLFGAELLESPDVYTQYLREGDEVIAGANLVVLRDQKTGYIEDVFTLGSRRGQGVGSQLMVGIVGAARELGLHHCTLVSVPDAVDFYAGLGFTLVSEMHGLLKP